MSDNSMTVTANPIPIDMDVSTEYHTYPTYHGSTEVEPTNNYQVLYTKNKLVTENIVVAPNPNTPREFIITVYIPPGGHMHVIDKTNEEIWTAFRRKDTIWFQMGRASNEHKAIQRAVITDNGFDDYVNPSQMSAHFAGNFGLGWGFYGVYYVSGIGLVVNFDPVQMK